jgi:hypothetical protein
MAPLFRRFFKTLFGAMAIAASVALAYALPITPTLAPSVPEPLESPGTPQHETVSVLFVGDMFFDRFIRRVMETAGGDYVFSCMYPLLAQADFVVGNLEGPITPYASVTRENSVNEPDHFKFTFPPSVAETLKRHNFAGVNIGNNHIGNFGLEGMRTTREYLDAAGVGHFGGLSGDEPVLHKDSNEVPLSFISYNQFGGDSAEMVAKKKSGRGNPRPRRDCLYSLG